MTRPASMQTSRSTTRTSTCTTCSIQTIASPPARSSRTIADEPLGLGVGQPAGDLVEQQQPRAGRQRPRQLETLAVEQAERLGAAVGDVDEAGRVEHLQRLSHAPRARAGPRPASPPTSTFSNTVMPLNGRGTWWVRPMPQAASCGGREMRYVGPVEADRCRDPGGRPQPACRAAWSCRRRWDRRSQAPAPGCTSIET